MATPTVTPTLIKGTVYLKSGRSFDVLVTPDRSISASSMSDGVLQTFLSADKSRGYFVQGDRIDYIELEQ